MVTLFKKTKELEHHIDEYLDLVNRGGLLFRQGIKYYLAQSHTDFEERLQELDAMESKGDSLRRTIESMLYEQTLIPESRGDVLGLLESTDNVLNMMSETLIRFSVEKPKFPEDLQPICLDLTEASVAAVESMVQAIRCYFRELYAVRDHITRVLFYEKESDQIGMKIKKIVFERDLHLSEKMHLRDFVNQIERIADASEDVCDRLNIATIKRYF